MKKMLISVFILLAISCADNKTIKGVTYRPYGFFNEDMCKNDSVVYRVSPWAAVSGILFCELIIPTVYTYGYNLWEPVRMKNDSVFNKGVIK